MKFLKSYGWLKWLGGLAGLGLVALTAGPTKATPKTVQPEDRVIELLTELSSGLADADDDCDAVAVQIRTWADDHQGELPGLVEAVDTRVSELDEEETRVLDRQMAELMQVIIESAIVCAAHEETVTAFEEVDTLLHPASAKPTHNPVSGLDPDTSSE